MTKSAFAPLFACFIILWVMAACTSQNTPSDALEPPKPIIRLAENSWLNAKLNTAVARILLEEEMGYPVEVIPIDGGTQFPAMADGDVQASLEVWPSGRGDEIAEYTEAGKVEIGGELGVVGKIGWFVPSYLIEDHPELSTWEGLKIPENVALFRTPETGGKGHFLSGPAEWPLIDDEIVLNLELDFVVEHAKTEEDLLAALDAAYSNQEPIIFYFWSPHPAFTKYELTEVQLPEYTDECDAMIDTVGWNCGYPPDVLIKIFSSTFRNYAPDAYTFLKNFRYTNEDQIMMLGLVEFQGKTIDEAARFWIEQNEDVWKPWIP